ncbi:MAG: hypothetical protein LBH26_05110 [Treponema sp.]|jgi:hypothetical protein|nr:hypothetical protein [Treponema sp.]
MIPLPRFFRIGFIGSAFLLATGVCLSAQESSLAEMFPALKEQAVVINIVARVIENNQQEIFNYVNSRVTIPGRPVGIKLVGSNLVVAVQFTPFFSRGGKNVLMAQGQIWVEIPNEGMRYRTTLQTISMEFGEQVYFYPLGSVTKPEEARIEIQLELLPYKGKEGDEADISNAAAKDGESESSR